MPEANDGPSASHGMREEGMFPRNKKSVGAVVAFSMVLAMVLTVPAGAAGWPVWGDAPSWAGQFLPRALAWLGFVKSQSSCGEQGAGIDPSGTNGCSKAKPGASIDPNRYSGAANDQGLHIDPNGSHVTDGGLQVAPNG
jgi:hypothetical protein